MDHQLTPIKPWKRALSLPFYGLALLFRVLNKLRRLRSDRVLVLEPVGMGDLITSEPLIRELERQGEQVLVASRPIWRQLLPPSEKRIWCDIWLPWSNPDIGAKYALPHYLKSDFWHPLWSLHKAARGCIAVDPRGDIRSVLLLHALGCKRVLSLSNYLGSNSRIPSWLAETIPFQNTPRWQLNLGFVEQLFPSFQRSQSTPPSLWHLIKPHRTRRVALVPVAPWKGKWWRPERWGAVIHALHEKDFDVVALCGPRQAELTQQALGASVPVIECSSIEQWAEQINTCSLVITVDSGPMHLADALQTPLVALFGQGFVPLWEPSGSTSIAISHQDEEIDFVVCHITEENVPLGRRLMDRITVEEVLAAANRLLSELRKAYPPLCPPI